jgi:superfamily II DNA/RNA helicase
MAARRPRRSTAPPPTSVAPTTAAAASAAPATAAPALAAKTFIELGVPQVLAARLEADGITTPFPIQAATLPDTLAGRDVLGRGRTGSGKTLGFLLPLLSRLAAQPRPRRPNRPRALILAPTRELAAQIHAAATPLADAVGLRTAVVFGGVGARPQISALRSGIDLLVACPGRLLDHLDAGHAQLDAVEITVLDEADHMADLGFLPAVERILKATPSVGQRMLFSATLDNGVDRLVRRFLDNPVTHAVDSSHSEVPDMTHHVLHVDATDRLPILIELTSAAGRTIVFARTKHGARKLTRQLAASGVPAVELHGNLAQAARMRNLEAFSEGRATTLVATDIAARGIHVEQIAVVVHADPPVEPKAYLHRSGRTARAGSSGTVITLMTDAQVPEVRDLIRKARIKATTTRLRPGDPLIRTLAPGERSFATPEQIAALTRQAEKAAPTGAATARTGDKPRRNRSKKPATRTTYGSPTAQNTGRTRRSDVRDAGAARAAEPPRNPSAKSGGAKTGGAKTGGAKTGGAKTGGARTGGATGGAKTGGAAAASRNFRGRGGRGGGY